MFNGDMDFQRRVKVDVTQRVLTKTAEGMEVQFIYHTAKGISARQYIIRSTTHPQRRKS